MRHAILGAGGVGSLVGGALARAGADVVLLLRPETHERHPGKLRVQSVALGEFEADVTTATALDREVDVLWVGSKATQLVAALELAPPRRVGDAVVVPLLNGVDHAALLHERYEHVLAAAMWVESTRVEPGLVVHKRGSVVALAPGPQRDEIAEDLRAGGLGVALGPDEPTVLWEKLAFLAPLALTTTALGATVGTVQADPNWKLRLDHCHSEAVAVGLADGATLDREKLRNQFDFPGGDMQTSMQKDFDAGRPLELDAIAGPIVRGGRRHEIATPATEELVRLVETRSAVRDSSTSSAV